MDDLELTALYTGYGYQVRIVEYGFAPSKESVPSSDHDHDVEINYNMAASMEWAYSEIRKIQKAARSGKPIDKPRWPILILRTPKGWTGPKRLNGNPIEGSWRAHQVPLPAAATDDEQFKLLEEWLKEYKPEELFDLKITSADSRAHDSTHKSEALIDSTVGAVWRVMLGGLVGFGLTPPPLGSPYHPHEH
jgi:xylulose-5-phosphate/fructose-6-phosphate phosphoketolase